MPDKRLPTDLGIDLSERDCNRLRLLNDEMAQAEQWISRRSSEMVAAYGLATAQIRHTARLDEDVELIATVLFLLRKDHPDFAPGRHRVVTRIDIPILPATLRESDANGNGTRTARPFPDRGEDWCPLFLELYERALQKDAAKLLSIGTLCIDIALIQQQLRSW
ncbi:hypothetical protein [Paraburkholderia terrae]|uniref:hypothetical protein n=1 Tax=Paraburkholderia TaxID=1822464 RepID=UPI001EE1F289|nr:hypothetical protein [Paraburkholderia terrae]BEU21239.1 hypothetical protein PBP221_13790 [Paraburkholderia sp. 22B1P]GJH06966.1 hypothetical protein CBA19C8_40435 [Paraburkholderia terrae]GJH38737.1 hypothetical protein CBA19CS91_38290 [Paraburkholderia hospita]